MFYGNAQSIVTFIRSLLTVLIGFYRMTFNLKSSFEKYKYMFD